MENQPQPLNTGSTVQAAPNSTAILVLGILSIVLCWCYGIIGLVLGIISLSLSAKSKRIIAEQPELYEQGSVKNLNAGRICAIIGTILSSIYVIIILVYIIFLGAMFSAMPWEMIMEEAAY